jgi:serine protease Do
LAGAAGLCGFTTIGGAEPRARYDVADLKALQNAFVGLADIVRPSVVAIRCYEIRNANNQDALVKVPVAQGSGFVFDADGYIATNKHVIEGCDVTNVILHDGRSFEATVQKDDVRSDLAVLKIDATGLQPARWGDVANVRVNQWAFAAGNPFGLANESGDSSITVGVVSALGRQMTHRIAGDASVQYYGNLIETSATINPGNSGGPLFNLEGEVIGVVTAIETSSGVNEGIGFAIPIDANTRQILDTLKDGREVRYGFLGVSVNDMERSTETRQVSDSRYYGGARIVRLDPPDGPAGAAGLQADDVVVEVNGVPIRNTDHLVRMVGFTPVGASVEVTYLRNEIKRKTTITIGDRYELLKLGVNAKD